MSDLYYVDPGLLTPWLGLGSSPNAFWVVPETLSASPNARPCLICLANKSKFYCQDCVSKGDLCHSNLRYPDSMSDKRQKLQTIDHRKDQIAKLIQQKKQGQDKINTIRENISLVKNRKKLLNYLLDSKTKQLKRSEEEVERLTAQNVERRKRLPEFAHKVEQIWRIKRHVEESRSKEMMQEKGLEVQISQLRKNKASELTKHIFIIQEVFPERQKISDNELESMIYESLSEAIHTSFVNGRWVTTANEISGEMMFQIVAPQLPSSGDYSAYQAWMQMRDKTESELAMTGLPNPAQTITSGLMFAAQLTQVLSYVFDVILPFKRLKYQDFGKIISGEYKFNRKVTRLNLNILFLCLSQGVSPENLRPKQTLHNLKQLIELLHEESMSVSCSVGKSFQPLWDSEFLHEMSIKLSEELKRLEWTAEDYADDDDDEEDIMECRRGRHFIPDEDDWDALSDDLIVALPHWLQNVHMSSRSGSSSSLSSTATSIVSSLWRGFTS